MSSPRSSTSIASAAELSVWWAEVLSEAGTGAGPRRLSLMWLDGRGRMVARVLSLDGVALRPTPKVIAVVGQLHGVFVEHADVADGHLAFALSRPGDTETTGDDQAWAVALRTAMRDASSGTWSFHVAAGGWILPVVDPPADSFDPRRVAIHSLAELVDRTWLRDQNNGHGYPLVGIDQGAFQPGDRRRRRHA